MRFRALFTTIWATLLAAIVLASALVALAAEGGEGLYGKTNDKVITNFGYGLMIGFTLLVTLLTLGQYLLERRKGPK
jgi:hypothetical protein